MKNKKPIVFYQIYRVELLIMVSLLFITSCSQSSSTNISANSKSGSCDGSNYTVNGKKYRTLSSASEYKAEGIVKIYSHKSQNSQTASCESFDINGFTASHRTLPLPSHIKITNKSNNKSVIVKVNDRGPSDARSLIEVTPAVASVLGASSTFSAHIEVITSAKISPSIQSVRSSSGQSSTSSHLRKVSKLVNRTNSDRYYIVVGTYNSRDKAFDRFIRVSSIGLPSVAMESRKIKGKSMHMVRLGPYYNQDKIDNAKDRLKNDGLIKFKVVKN